MFALSTSIGFAQKALNVRREARVALLFADPTGSGLDRAGQVLVQGEAECPDEIVTRFSRNADLWERLTGDGARGAARTGRRAPVRAMPGLPEAAARELGEFPSGVLTSLDARGPDRPQVPWHELEDIHARVSASRKAR